MIGGTDIAIEGGVAAEDVDLMLRLVRGVWPAAVIETGDATRVATIEVALRELGAMRGEFFIYETQSAYESWTASGLTNENADQMISIVVEPDCISFVVSTEEAPTYDLVVEIAEALRANRRIARAAAA